MGGRSRNATESRIRAGHLRDGLFLRRTTPRPGSRIVQKPFHPEGVSFRRWVWIRLITTAYQRHVCIGAKTRMLMERLAAHEAWLAGYAGGG